MLSAEGCGVPARQLSQEGHGLQRGLAQRPLAASDWGAKRFTFPSSVRVPNLSPAEVFCPPALVRLRKDLSRALQGG